MTPDVPSTRAARLHLSEDPVLDRLTALELGRVDEGQPPGAWRTVGEHVGILVDDGREVGFCVMAFSGYDPDDPAHASLWDGPRFTAPGLGLADASPNEIVVAARALHGGRQTVNRTLFSAAIDARGPRALRRWLRCLQAGDSMAHYALGYTLFEMGRVHEAYRHLRYYSEIAPRTAWAWTWRGRAAAAMGHLDEAREAYALAIDLEDDDDPTDAAALLERLEAGDIERPEPGGDDWSDEVLSLVEELGLGAAVMVGDRDAVAILDVEAAPTRIMLFRDEDAVSVRALIGTLPDLEAEDEDDVRDVLAGHGFDARDGVFDGDALWCEVEAVLDVADPRVIEAFVVGVAHRAAELRPHVAALDALGPLEPGPTFEELVRGFEGEG